MIVDEEGLYVPSSEFKSSNLKDEY
jgi:hypothetical protein